MARTTINLVGLEEPGRYPVVVVGAELIRGMLNWTFRITSGAHAGEDITMTTPLRGEQARWLYYALSVLGVETTRLMTFEFEDGGMLIDPSVIGRAAVAEISVVKAPPTSSDLEQVRVRLRPPSTPVS
jgi:hypothetical protein